MLSVLLLALYFTFTNPYFLKAYLLPAISNATGTKIAAKKVSFLPFSSKFELNKLVFEPSSEFKLKGKKVTCEYSFWDFFRGEIKINSLKFDDIIFDIKNRASYSRTQKTHPVKSFFRKQINNNAFSWLKFDINNLSIRNSSVNFEYTGTDKDDIFELNANNINISTSRLTSNSKTKFVYNCSFKINKNKNYDMETGKINGVIDCFIAEDWDSARINLSATFNSFSGFSKSLGFNNKKLFLKLFLHYSDNTLIINDFSFQDLSSKEKILADIRSNGKIYLDPLDIQLNIKKCFLSADFLNILGGLHGVVFNNTALNYSGRFLYSKKRLQSIGSLNLLDFSMSTGGFKFFGDNLFDIHLKNNFICDFQQEKINVKTFCLTVNDKKNKIIDLEFPDKFSLTWSKSKDRLKPEPDLPAIALNITNFDLSILENLAGRYLGLQLLKGTLNAKLNTSINEDMTIKLKGTTDIAKLGLGVNNTLMQTFNLKQNIDAEVISFKELIIKAIKTTVFVDSKEVTQLTSSGKINFEDQSGTIRTLVKKALIGALNNLSTPIIKDTLGIKTLSLDGFVDLDYKNGGQDLGLKANLRADDLLFYEVKNAPKIPALSGDIEAYFVKDKDKIKIEKFICDIDTPVNRLGNLAATGKFYLKPNSGRSKLNLYSEGIDLKKSINIFNSITGIFTINLKDANFDTNFYLQNIIYDRLVFNCTANAAINNGFLKITPISLSLNNAPIEGEIKYDFNPNKNNYFYVALNASNIKLAPLLSTFGSKIYSRAEGSISSFSTKFEGKGFSLQALEQNFKGQLHATFDGISLPDNTSQYDYARLIFIPIEVISQINNLIGDVNIPLFFNNLIQYSNNIFSQQQNLVLNTGYISLNAKDGRIYIDPCIFKGDGDPIDKLNFNGSIGFDKNVDLNAIVKINQLIIIPLHIAGTVSNPSPDLMNFTTFMEDDFADPAGKGIFEILTTPESIIEKMSEDADVTLERLIP